MSGQDGGQVTYFVTVRTFQCRSVFHEPARAETLVEVTGGRLYPVTVTGPVGLPVRSHFGILGGRGPKTAVIEMAAAAGLRLVPRTQRNPLATTTYGVGELIRAALDN